MLLRQSSLLMKRLLDMKLRYESEAEKIIMSQQIKSVAVLTFIG